MKRPDLACRVLCVLAVLAVSGVADVSAQATAATNTAEVDAKLAKYFEFYSRGLPTLTIEEEIARATKANAGRKPSEIVISTSKVQVSTQHLPASQRPPGIPFLLLQGVSNADLIVMGVPQSARSLPISDCTFLFTQYSVRVSRIFSDDPRGVSPGDTIIVSMGGGSLMVDGVLVRAIDPAFDQFSLHQPLILMVKAFPGTGTYQAVAPWTFTIKGGLVAVASKIQPGRGAGQKSLPDFLFDVENAVAYARSRRK
jgi:hypothetical protein